MSLYELFPRLLDILQEPGLVSVGMIKMIEGCVALRPGGDWRRFLTPSVDDLADLAAWVHRVTVDTPPPPRMRTLWFGLSNPIGKGCVTTDLRMCGSDRPFSADSDWSQMVTWQGSEWAHSAVLEQIRRVAHSDPGLGFEAEHVLSLAYSSLAVRNIFSEARYRQTLLRSEWVRLVVGFDAGDWIQLGDANRESFRIEIS